MNLAVPPSGSRLPYLVGIGVLDSTGEDSSLAPGPLTLVGLCPYPPASLLGWAGGLGVGRGDLFRGRPYGSVPSTRTPAVPFCPTTHSRLLLP